MLFSIMLLSTVDHSGNLNHASATLYMSSPIGLLIPFGHLPRNYHPVELL